MGLAKREIDPGQKVPDFPSVQRVSLLSRSCAFARGPDDAHKNALVIRINTTP